MIIINPVKDTRDPNTDAARTHINWVLPRNSLSILKSKATK